MASLERDPDSGNYRLRFRYGGIQFKRSLDTTSRSEARTRLVRFRETEKFVAQRRIEIPIDVDPAEFLLSDGRLTRPTTPVSDQRSRRRELSAIIRVGSEGPHQSKTAHHREVRPNMREVGPSSLEQSPSLR